jgi:hypothetical protein
VRALCVELRDLLAARHSPPKGCDVNRRAFRPSSQELGLRQLLVVESASRLCRDVAPPRTWRSIGIAAYGIRHVLAASLL